MANLCSYDIKITGETREAVEKTSEYIFTKLSILNSGYADDVLEENGLYTQRICGACKWSVHSAMLSLIYESEYTLDEVSKNNNVLIEVFSEECGFEFQEHFRFVFGHQNIDDEDTCVNWEEYCVDDYEGKTLEEKLNNLNECCETTFTEQDVDSDGYIHVGGFDDYLEFKTFTKEEFEELKEDFGK